MAKKKTNIDSTKLSQLVLKGMQEKKAENIAIIDLKNIKNAVADYFVVCSGTSDNHADAISNSVEEEVFKSIGQWPWQAEGRSNKEWILLDYVDVVVHILLKEKREFYGIEDLWGDAAITRHN
jgi:ribosome-associated protein